MADSFSFTLHNPLLDEEWDMITDVDFEHTDEITFYTKHGKEVRFSKAPADVEPVVHCRDCIFGHKCVDVTNGIITAIWVECINPDGLHRSVPCGGFCHVGIKRKEENGQ